jgi:hypothetical protein
MGRQWTSVTMRVAREAWRGGMGWGMRSPAIASAVPYAAHSTPVFSPPLRGLVGSAAALYRPDAAGTKFPSFERAGGAGPHPIVKTVAAALRGANGQVRSQSFAPREL